MESTKSTSRIHPLIAAAAIAVLLVSLTGVAAMTGLLPSSHSTTNPESSPLASSATDENKITEKNSDPAKVKAEPTVKHHASSSQHEQTANICGNCGRVESIQAVQQAAKPSGLGVVAGAVIGGVLGNQVGGGNGRAISTVAGAVGGGFAGNEVEKRTRTTTSYQVHVRMEDGSVRTFPQSTQDGWRVGDRVKVVNGALTSEG